jgi:hypothetical protein
MKNKYNYTEDKKCSCGKPISNNAKYCLKCYRASMKGKNHPNYKHRDDKLPKCIYCDIKLSDYEHKLCKDCYLKILKTQRGENSPVWKGGKPKCKDCGKELSTGNCKKRKIKRCSKCSKKLELNPNWQDGISFLPYSTEWSLELKESIRKRDNYKCAICNKLGKDVHHINYDKTDCSESNLITLCRKHHLRTNFDRDYWYAYFTYVMENLLI